METEINRFFEICQWDENGQSMETQDDTERTIEAGADSGYDINNRSMAKKITINNWDVELGQTDSDPVNKPKDLDTEISKFFDICQQD